MRCSCKKKLLMKSRSNHNLEARVCAITISILCLDPSEIWPDARFREELGADSLDLAELIVALSREFNITICDENVRQIETVGQAIDYLDTHYA